MKVVNILKETKAIKLDFKNHFVWVSGIKSPIYCDNRVLNGYPQARNFIVDQLIKSIKSNYSDVELIAGVATLGISWAAIIADRMGLPLIYVRDKAKEYGTKSQIEGFYEQHKKVVVIEDLISTGTSALKAVAILKNSNLNVIGVQAIFSYNLKQADNNFTNSKTKLFHLSSVDDLIISLEKTSEKEQLVNFIKDF